MKRGARSLPLFFASVVDIGLSFICFGDFSSIVFLCCSKVDCLLPKSGSQLSRLLPGVPQKSHGSCAAHDAAIATPPPAYEQHSWAIASKHRCIVIAFVVWYA